MKLRDYQQRGVEWLDARKYSLMFLPMGAGKTAICCAWLAQWDMKVLIVAPLRVAETVWPVELPRWAPGVSFRVVTGRAANRKKAMAAPADVTIANYENLVWLLENTDLDYDAIIFDELTNMKNWSAKRVKAFWKKRSRFETRIGLTGTPTSNGIKNLYAQLKCIDGGHRLGKTLKAFRMAWMMQGWTHWDWTPRAGALIKITRLLKDIAFTVTDEEYADQLPPLVTNYVDVELPADVRKHYNELVREFITDFEEATVVTPTVGAQIIKLQQIADGFAYYDNGKKATWVHEEKLKALDEIVDSQQGAPMLVVYRFREELAAMRKRHPGTVMNEGDARTTVEEWNAGAIPILYIHPRSAGHGLNLQDGGNTLVFFGFTWSWEEYVQVIARLLRSGQKKTVFLHLIRALGTVDVDIVEALETHADTGAKLLGGLRGEKA